MKANRKRNNVFLLSMDFLVTKVHRKYTSELFDTLEAGDILLLRKVVGYRVSNSKVREYTLTNLSK